jgi:hypothetical protein
MSNQVFLWGSIILPWFSLLLLKKEDVKRYMPVALFTMLVSTIVSELGVALQWWVVIETIFPFYHIVPYTFGAYPVGAIWIFKFTYKRFLLYMFTNVVIDYIANYPLQYFAAQRGIYELVNATNFQILLLSIVFAVILYGYQMWQEGMLLPSEQTARFSSKLQSVAAKPLPKDEDQEED